MNRLMASDGVSLAWEQWGDENAGPPVLLCHGFGINVEVNWVLPGVVNALVAAGRRVVGLHARDMGTLTSRTIRAFMAKTGWRSTCLS